MGVIRHRMGKIGLRKIFGVDDDDEEEEEEGGEFGEIGEPPSQRAPAAGETAKSAFYQTLENIHTWTSIFMNSLSNNLLLQSSAVPMPRFSRDANSFEKVKVKLLAAAAACCCCNPPSFKSKAFSFFPSALCNDREYL